MRRAHPDTHTNIPTEKHRMAKKLKKVEPQQVKAADIPVKARRGKSLAETMMDYPDPDHRWDRPLQAPGRMPFKAMMVAQTVRWAACQK